MEKNYPSFNLSIPIPICSGNSPIMLILSILVGQGDGNAGSEKVLSAKGTTQEGFRGVYCKAEWKFWTMLDRWTV